MSKFSPHTSVIHLAYSLIPIAVMGGLFYCFYVLAAVTPPTPVYEITSQSTAIIKTLQGTSAQQNTFIRANQLVEPGDVADSTSTPSTYVPVTLDDTVLGKSDLLKFGP